ncbi:MAG: hypothetical protein GC193_08310 [Cryomorphaceae bacterium]|nr:hypothetical protein [Cryomorphaceae bacterium]
MRYVAVISLLVVLTVAVGSCKKKTVDNPYEVETVIVDNPVADELPYGNFAWLHAKVFKPTCANSGCHDGTFEPHFATISSSYNSLVNHAVISNDAQFSYTYRVVPGALSSSLLYTRMTENIPNTTGIMPAVVDAGSDWPAMGTVYKNVIKAWIENGAIDMYGNAPGAAGGDFPPQVEGFAVFPQGNTTEPYLREEDGIGITPVLVDNGLVDVWVRVSDDNTTATSLTVNELRFATEISGIDAEFPVNFSTSATIQATDFSNGAATFYHKATIDLSSYAAGTSLFLRTYFSDGVQTATTVIPNENSNPIITSIFVLKIQ